MRDYSLDSIKFSKKTINELLMSYNKRCPTENGGILIGQVNSNQILITDFTEPNCFDRAERLSFVRSIKGINKVIRKYFRLSNNTKTYLGEWHTHHEDYPCASSTDIDTIKDQFQKNTRNVPFVLSLIIGYQGCMLMIYDGRSLRKKIYKMTE